MVFNLKFAIECFPEILSALPVTMELVFVGMFFSTVFGFLLALCRIYKVPVLNKFAYGYLLVIRGIPLMVQLYFVFVALPIWCQSFIDWMEWDTYVDLPPMLVAAVALSCNYTAYMAELVRGALASVPHGQMEACQSVGMTNVQAMVHVIIPQAVVEAIPNLGNIFIGLIKDTSLAYMVMVMDIMGMAKKVAGAGLNYLETYVVAACIYWILNIILERLFGLWERHANRFNSKIAPMS